MSKKQLADFFQLVEELTTLKDSLEVFGMKGVTGYEIQVKGKGREFALIPLLKEIKKQLTTLYPSYQKVDGIKDDVGDWIDYFNANYSLKSKFLKEPEALREKDLPKLSNDVERWLDKLYRISEAQYILEKQASPLKIPVTLTKGLDKETREDLKDAFQAMDYGLFTAAYMLVFRVAENEIIRLYKKMTKTQPHNLPWGDMLNNMYKEYGIKLPSGIRNIAYYLRDKRNEAQHPGKRFTKDDCAKIRHYLSDLKNEIDKL